MVEFLLERGVDLGSRSGDGQTGLHWAVIGGHLDTVKALLLRNAPLEVKNRYGGTVLGQALWSAAHGGDSEIYIKIIETLIAAGAEVPRRHVPVNRRVDDWLERHGSHAEPRWYWYDEEPRDVTRGNFPKPKDNTFINARTLDSGSASCGVRGRGVVGF